MPAASTAVALHAVTARARLPGGKPWRTSASDAGTIAAAPTPWIARAAISTPTEGAAAASAEARVKITIPATYTRRRPYRSAKRPARIINAANVMLYAFSTHESSESVAP